MFPEISSVDMHLFGAPTILWSAKKGDLKKPPKTAVRIGSVALANFVEASTATMTAALPARRGSKQQETAERDSSLED